MIGNQWSLRWHYLSPFDSDVSKLTPIDMVTHVFCDCSISRGNQDSFECCQCLPMAASRHRQSCRLIRIILNLFMHSHCILGLTRNAMGVTRCTLGQTMSGMRLIVHFVGHRTRIRVLPLGNVNLKNATQRVRSEHSY